MQHIQIRYNSVAATAVNKRAAGATSPWATRATVILEQPSVVCLSGCVTSKFVCHCPVTARRRLARATDARWLHCCADSSPASPARCTPPKLLPPGLCNAIQRPALVASTAAAGTASLRRRRPAKQALRINGNHDSLATAIICQVTSSPALRGCGGGALGRSGTCQLSTRKAPGAVALRSYIPTTRSEGQDVSSVQ